MSKFLESIYSYKLLNGEMLFLENLSQKEKEMIVNLIEIYKLDPDWTKFAAYVNEKLQENNIAPNSIVYLIGGDLEGKLGVKQGKCVI